MKEKILDIENLVIETKSGRKLVQGISFSMTQGEVLGIVGESGSGKTISAKTIVNLLPQELTFSADKFQVFGQDYLSLSLAEKRRLIGSLIGYVPQNTVYFLHPMIRIRNQIADGYIRDGKVSRTKALERAKELLNLVGIRDDERLLHSFPWQLSGGMRQRVNIAMAMLNGARLIIADEPTTALDSTVQKQVVDLFAKANQETGASILMISHDLGLVRHYCQRLLVMYAGQILEEGSSSSVFANPRHPYTQALIRVIPSLNIRKGERLAEIPGYIPRAGSIRQGCLFRARCSKCQEVCNNQVQEVVLSPDHIYRCNF